VGEPFGLVARFGMNNACYGLETPFEEARNLVDTPLEGCRDMFVHEGSPRLGCDDVIRNFLEHSRVSPMYSQPSFSPELDFDVPIDNFEICDSNVDMGSKDNALNTLDGNVETFESLGYFSGYDATLDPYCINLVDKPRKILWNTFFAFFFDFSMVLTLRELILIFVLILMFSHSHACKAHVVEFDKLLRALTVSDLNKLGFDVMELPMLCVPRLLGAV